ncbi:hypothetical protein IX84_25920 [Phaeodactylibacter xiamenensis]|uniref:Uncharacterized protein n=2 Tax=Phaeodactylibacter xiamenensis TaxID=1524460 RepID=A0A098S131_9BACT|nr:hypothetical protein IX84_25920 [Phaeodactylibacter xiamenensis]
MKNSFVLFFAFMLGIILVSCSGDAPDNNSETETTAKTEAPAAQANPDKSKVVIPQGQSADEFVFTKLKKGLDKRGIKFSADQDTALRQLISENDLTPENLKAKRAEILRQVQEEILTDEQKAMLKK